MDSISEFPTEGTGRNVEFVIRTRPCQFRSYSSPSWSMIAKIFTQPLRRWMMQYTQSYLLVSRGRARSHAMDRASSAPLSSGDWRVYPTADQMSRTGENGRAHVMRGTRCNLL